MNLGPWKYRNILSSSGGPILKIDSLRLESPLLKTVYEAYAELSPSVLSSTVIKDHKVYGTADGCGTSPFANLARYKAISEALERWAFYEVAHFKRTHEFGYDVDRSTTGMAAFPGLTASEASENAFYEAVERWSLCAWWEGKLQAKKIPDQNGIEILSAPLLEKLPVARGRKFSVVVLWNEPPGLGRICYGFSCASTLEKTIQRASIELDRNRRVLSDLPPLSEISEHGEKRLLYFSTSEGHKHWEEQAERSFSLSSPLSAPPALVTNSAIPGPWSKYCHVWRCLFEPVSSEHLSARSDYFLF
jgi:hypothetical protein